MAIALKNGPDGILQQIQIGDSLQADSFERLASSGNLLVGSLLGAVELRLGSPSALTRSMGDAQIDGELRITDGAGDTSPLLDLDQTGANPGRSRWRAGGRNPETNITANAGDFYVRDGGAASSLYVHRGTDSTAVGWQDLTSGLLNESSGVLTGGELGAGSASDQFSITNGDGRIRFYSSPITPDAFDPIWTGLSDIEVTLIATTSYTSVFIDSTASVVQISGMLPSEVDYRDKIYIGLLTHFDNATIDSFDPSPQLAYGTAQDVRQTTRSREPIVQSGIDIFPKSGGVLQFGITPGKFTKQGVAFHATPETPSDGSFPGVDPAEFARVFGDGSNGGNLNIETESTNDLDPSNYNVNGVLTAVPGSANRATIQRLYLAPFRLPFISYGQEFFSDMATAQTVAGSEAFIESGFEQLSVLLARFIIRKGATDAEDLNDLVIIETGGASGGGGGGVTQLLQLTDTPDPGSFVGNAGLLFGVDSAETAMEFVNHGDLTLASGPSGTNGIHVSQNYIFANEAAQAAEVVAADDVGKMAFRTDLDILWAAVTAGTGMINWRHVTETIKAAISSSLDTTTSGTFQTKVSVPLLAIDGTWFIFASALLSHSNITGNPSARLFETTTSTAIMTRDWIGEMQDVENVLSPFLVGSIVTSNSDSPPLEVALQYAVESGTGTLSISDAIIRAEFQE